MTIEEIQAELQKRNLTLENIMDYVEFEDHLVKHGFTAKTVLKLVEKEIPYKPTPCTVTLGRCKCGVGFLDKSTNYCGNCGQKLDWT